MRSIYVRIWAIGVITGIVISLCVVWLVNRNSDSKSDLIDIFNKIEIGTSTGSAAAMIISTLRRAELHTSLDGSTTKWYASSTPQLMQGHWILVICIENDRVVGKRFGLGDDVSIAPTKAPREIGTCNPK